MNIDRFLLCGVSEAIVMCMMIHDTIGIVLECGCKAIRNLSHNTVGREKLGSVGACEAVASALIHFSDNFNVIEWACRAIYNLCFTSNANRERFCACNISVVLVCILQKHIQIGHVTEWVSKAAGILAHNNETNRVLLGDLGLCEVMMQVITTHVTASLAGGVTVSSPPDTSIEYKTANDTSSNSHSPIIDVYNNAEKLTDSTDIVNNISSTTTEIPSKNPQFDINVHAATSTSTSTTTNKSMNVNISATNSTESLLETACWVIGNLGYLNESNQRKMESADVCHILVSILSTFLDSIPIVKSACRAVRNLCHENPSLQEVMGHSGACESILAAIRRHEGYHRQMVPPSNNQVSQWGWLAISSLCGIESNRERCGACGACETAVLALIVDPHSAEVAHWGCRVIGTLAKTQINCVKLGAAGVSECLVYALRVHGYDKGVAEEACYAIGILATITENRHWLGNAEACWAVVCWAMNRHEYSPVVCEYGCTFA